VLAADRQHEHELEGEAMSIRIEEVPGGTVFRNEPAHVCDKPAAERYDVGDTFVCKECAASWVVSWGIAYGSCLVKEWERR
jgi:hypoxanthine-guanine phosphoribosyltransferase